MISLKIINSRLRVLATVSSRLRVLATFTVLAAVFSLAGDVADVFAHGGEDHGDQKPAVAKTENGMVSRTARLGDFEILLKHALLEPDKGMSARLFLTKFETNEPVGDANITMEAETANGAVIAIPVQKSESAGSYVLTMPALAEGAYTLRARLSASGKTDTATFSGVEVTHQQTGVTPEGYSLVGMAVTGFLFLIGFALFGGLIYLAFRAVSDKPRGEALTA